MDGNFDLFFIECTAISRATVKRYIRTKESDKGKTKSFLEENSYFHAPVSLLDFNEIQSMIYDYLEKNR